MIDPALPIRFCGSDGDYYPMHGRCRIVGNDGMGHHRVRYHDGTNLRTTRINEHGWSVEVQAMPPVENYEIDWDRPLAFIDTAERGHLSHFPGTKDRYGVRSDDGSVFWYRPSGAPVYGLDEDGVITADVRPIMNIETDATRARDAKVRTIVAHNAAVDADRERAKNEANPLWGMF